MMNKKTLTAILAGAMALLAARGASSQDMRASSLYTPRTLSPAPLPFEPLQRYSLGLPEAYSQRGGSFLDTLSDLYEQSEIGKRRADKLRLKREGIPDFETPSQAMAPRKAGKAGMHLNISSNDEYRIRVYGEAYIIRDPWTRVRKPGIQLQLKINY